MSTAHVQAAILQRTVQVLRDQLQARSGAAREFVPKHKVAVCLDLQNFHYMLWGIYQIRSTEINVVEFIRDVLAKNGFELGVLHVFTGIHDARESAKMQAMQKRLNWFQRAGAKITAIPLAYKSEGGKVRAIEKGVDVALGAEVVKLSYDGWQSILLVTQDRDIASAIGAAKDAGHDLAILTLAMDVAHGAESIGSKGLDGTTKLSISLNDVGRHTRERSKNER